MANLVIYIPKDLERRLQEAREDWKEHARVVAVEALKMDVAQIERRGPTGRRVFGVELKEPLRPEEEDRVRQALDAAVTERGQSSAPTDGAQGNPASSVRSPRSVTPTDVYH